MEHCSKNCLGVLIVARFLVLSTSFTLLVRLANNNSNGFNVVMLISLGIVVLDASTAMLLVLSNLSLVHIKAKLI